MSKRHEFGLRLAMMFAGFSLPSVEREDGQTLAEYALILSLIAAVVVGVIVILGTDISSMFSRIGASL